MSKFDWTSTVTVNFWVLKVVGLWPEEDKLYEPNFYTFYAIFGAVVFIGLHNLSQIINIYFVYSDLEAVTGIFFILLTNMLATTKMYFFARNLKPFKQLLTILNSDQFQPKSTDHLILVRPLLKLWKVLYVLYTTVVATNLTMWVLAPSMRGGYQLPFLAWYPFHVKKSPNYQIVYIYQVVSFCYITAANVNLDTITYAVFMYIRTQCDILCENLSRLDGENVEFNRALVSCIKHHETIVWFAKRSNSLFNVLILLQFATSTFVLALTMFQLSLVDSVNEDAFIRFLYIIGLLTQLFLYCWFGNEVEVKSGQILCAIYESQWFGQPGCITRNIQIFSERCHRPIKITAINLFDLSLKTFIAIVRTAWSYFAVLYKVNSR